MKNPEYIGIDPDTDKSGFAVLENGKCTYLGTLEFFDLLAELDKHEEAIVIVEAGWLNSITNYHEAAGKGGQRIALYVGQNQMIGMLIVAYCKRKGISCVEQKPLRKIWKIKGQKISHEEIVKITGIDRNRTNGEERDSLLLCWVYAGLPIKI